MRMYSDNSGRGADAAVSAVSPLIAVFAAVAAILAAGCHRNTPTAKAGNPGSQAAIGHVAQPTPPPLPTLPPRGLRGIHLTGWSAGANGRLKNIEGLIERTDLNAAAVDIIDDGQLSYDANVPLAIQTHASLRMFRVDRLIASLNQHNIWPIARIACMRNTPLARSHPELAVQTSNGKVWLDGSGYAWLNPYKKEVREYCIDLAIDAVKHGFKEVQFDYVRFPSYHVSTQRFPGRPAGLSHEDVIANFIADARQRVHAAGAWFSIDVFGLTSLVKDDEGIGQKLNKMASGADWVCPMVYPSHYHHGEYGIANPNAAPGEIITRSVRDAQKIVTTASGCRLRPWIQDFSLGIHYGPEQIKQQIKALKALGIEEYLLWNPRCEYTEAGIPVKPK